MDLNLIFFRNTKLIYEINNKDIHTNKLVADCFDF